MKLLGFILLFFLFQNVSLDAQPNLRSGTQQDKLEKHIATTSTKSSHLPVKYGHTKEKLILDDALTQSQASNPKKKKSKKKEKAKFKKEKIELSNQKDLTKKKKKTKSGEKDSSVLAKKENEIKKRRNSQSSAQDTQSSVATNQVSTNIKSRKKKETKKSKKPRNHSTSKTIQSYQLPKLNLDLFHKAIADHTQRVLVMTTAVLNWENDFNLFSPIGLYSALGMLSLMANKGSPSRKEINTLLGTNDKSLTPDLMYVWSEYWIKKNDLVFTNAFMRPSTFSSIEGTTLEKILKKSNTTFLDTETALNKFVDKATQGQIKKIPVQQKKNTQVFVNVIMLRFTWLNQASLTGPEDFYLDFHQKSKTSIHYMKHRVTTKFSGSSNYKACILPLATKVKGSTAPLAAYIFSFLKPLKKGTLGDHWKAIYEDLKQQKEGSIEILIPNAELEQKIEFSKNMFPNLLRKVNKDFNPIVAKDDVTVFLSQINKFCMDKEGVSAVSVTKVEISSRMSRPTMTFNKPFYVVLANPETGVAVFSAKVTKGLDSGHHSCMKSN
ncbi:hypothetical protein HMI54_005771 [Coelomomyces lativittatus]|nr:hypothetical protein HMI56_001497 [Coelomomyces lativittatus]KAJ1517402.1 hypothetical protein HMI54_005771 [Coelomomyces lativittatus]KAJ1518302.1 hypothetical protein HMI55_000017 [Coelomomyces lativittatus]